MNLNVSDWKPFKIQRTESQSGLFEIENCKCGSAGELDDGSDINYIGAKKSDNGVMRSVSLDGNTNLVSKGHGIMFICDGEGSVGYTNYMDSDFIGSTTTSIGYDDALTETNAMFLVSVLDNEKFKYSYGRKYRKNLITAEIYLPIQHNADGSIFTDDTFKYSDKGYVPDWQFMEDYIKSLHHKPLTTKNKKETVSELNIKNWKEFKVSDIFEVKYGVNLELNACVECNADDLDAVNFVARTAENNGVSAHVVRIDDVIPQKKGLISVAGGGSVLSTFLQTEPFYSGRDLYTLDSKDNISNAAKMFIITVIEQNKYKYSYGRQANKTLPDLILKLPVDSKGKPDYDFMENYIKSLPYGDRLEG